MVAWSPNPEHIPAEYRIGGYEVRSLIGSVEFMKLGPNKWVFLPHMYNTLVFLEEDADVFPNETALVDMLLLKATLGYYFDSRVKIVLSCEHHPIDIEDIWGYLADQQFVSDPMNNRFNPIDLTEESIASDDEFMSDLSTITEPTEGYTIEEDDTDAFFDEI